MSGFFENLTLLGPVLCVLEDLHWADEDTVGLLADLLARFHQWPMLVLVTTRPAEISAALLNVRSALMGSDGVESIALSPLSEESAASIIADTVGNAVSAQVVAEIQRVTSGNALWIAEAARKLMEVAGGTGHIHVGEELPATLTETIKLRLQDLDDSMTSMMTQASVLGNTIDPPVLAEVVGLPVDEVLEKLRGAEHQHLVLPPDTKGCYGFAHPLIESTLYESLDEVRLKRSHRRAGVALEQLLGEQTTTRAPELAHHFTKAGPNYAPKACKYSAAAGSAALEIAAYERAMRHLDAALSLLDTVDQSQRDINEFQLTIGKGMATMSLRGLNNSETAAVFSRVAELAETLPVSPELLPSFVALWAVKNQQFDAVGAREYEAKLQAIGELLPPGVDRLFGPWACLVDAVFLNDLDAVDDMARQCVALIEDPEFAGPRYLYGADIDPVALTYLCWSWALNTRADDPEKARGVLEHGKALIAQAVEPRRACSYSVAASVHRIRREIDMTAEAATASIEICERLKIVQWSVMAHTYQGWAQAMRGDPDGAARCRDAADMWHGNGSKLGVNLLAATVAEACIAVDEPRLAHRFIERAFEIYPATGQMFHLPSLIRAKAELAVLDRTLGDPEALYREALSVAQTQRARALELQVALSLAQWNLDLGHESLLTAVNRIGPHVDLPDVKAARSLLGI